MNPPRMLDELGARLSGLAANNPARDIEKNARALLGGAFERLDLVTREEFDVQREMLRHACEKLELLEHRVTELEAELAGRGRDE